MIYYTIFENDLNTIVDDGVNYILMHKNGGLAYFDKNSKILKAILEAIENYGSWQFHPDNSNGFHMAKPKSSNCLFNLRQLIVAIRDFDTLERGLEEVKRGKIKFKDGNRENCTNANLEFTRGDNVVSIVNDFYSDGDIIRITNKHRSKDAILSYSPELFESAKHFRWDCNDFNRFYTRASGFRVSLSHFAFCFYNREATGENIESKILSFRTEIEKDKTCIEHLNNNPLDNRRTNIHLTQSFLNSQKSDITDRIFAPYSEKCIFYKGYYGGYFIVLSCKSWYIVFLDSPRIV